MDLRREAALAWRGRPQNEGRRNTCIRNRLSLGAGAGEQRSYRHDAAWSPAALHALPDSRGVAGAPTGDGPPAWAPPPPPLAAAPPSSWRGPPPALPPIKPLERVGTCVQVR